MIALGLMEGSKEKAYEAMEILGNKLNISKKEMPDLILNTMANMIKNKVDEILNKINSQPVYTIKELLYGKQIEPKLINVIGGPAKVLAPILEKKFQLPCYYPDKYEVANAVGAALAKPTTEINMLVDTAKGILTVPELNIYEKVSKNYTLEDAKKKALELVKKSAINLGATEEEIESEITEESSFNMVRGFSLVENMRIKAQKPGLIYDLEVIVMIKAKMLGLVFFPADWAISPTHPEREERLLYTQDQIFEEGIQDIEGIKFLILL